MASLTLALAIAVVLAAFGWRVAFFNPLGSSTRGFTPFDAQGASASPAAAAWWLGRFGALNWVIFLANLIPALPFDGGRILRGWLAARDRDRDTSPYVARAVAVIIGVVGVVRIYFDRPGGWLLLTLALLVEWLVRHEARLMEGGGEQDEGVFGYDFSEGFGGPEAGSTAVRPRQAGALRRWSRRRSEARRLRRAQRALAEARRLDEILEKLHRDGRGGLTPEEQRFLDRVAAKLRKRKSRGGGKE
jgi:hypothetical protein